MAMNTKNTLTVAELIAQLQQMPEDAQVVFAYDYGDHWNTQVAGEVEEVEEGIVVYSSYHQSYKLSEEPEEDDEDQTKDSRRVVILK